MDDTEGQFKTHPGFWTRDVVQMWIQWCKKQYAIDIRASLFNMNGRALCTLTKEDFLRKVPDVGEVLYNVLQDHILHSAKSVSSNGQRSLSYGSIKSTHLPVYQPIKNDYDAQGRLINHGGSESRNVEGSIMLYGQVEPLDLRVRRRALEADVCLPAVHDARNSSLNDVSKETVLPQPQCLGCPPDSPDYCSLDDQSNLTPYSDSESGNFVIDENTTDSSNHDSSEMENIQSLVDSATLPRFESLVDSSTNKVKSESPPKVKPYKQYRTEDCRLLWEFLYDMLLREEHQYLVWDDKQNLSFRIKNPAGLAKLWGSQKKKNNMTYEKLSRAFRYYYKVDIMERVPHKRLTYRFKRHPDSIERGVRGAKPGIPHQKKRTSGKRPDKNTKLTSNISIPSENITTNDNIPSMADHSTPPMSNINYINHLTVSPNYTFSSSIPSTSGSSVSNNTFRTRTILPKVIDTITTVCSPQDENVPSAQTSHALGKDSMLVGNSHTVSNGMDSNWCSDTVVMQNSYCGEVEDINEVMHSSKC